MWDYEFIGNCGLHGIGPERAKIEYIRHDGSLDMWAKTLSYVSSSMADAMNNFNKNIVLVYCKKSDIEQFAHMKSVGHTGGMPDKDTKKLIRKLGWELVDGKRFDYLIVPSYDHESTKTKVAKEKGIEMFTEEDFVEEFSEDI